MNILLVHNFYQQPGGEDGVFAEEGRLLEQRGHRVARFTMHNDDVPALGKLTLAKKTIWNRDAAAKLRVAIREHQAKIVHFHNTFMLISPAAYSAARAEGAAVVQTLHNYRLLCPVATFYRDGKVCEDCLGKTVPWPGVVHKCYRDSTATSGVVAGMLTAHRIRGTFRHDVDRYIALTEFARDKYVEGGLPADRIVVKPNFVEPDPGMGRGNGDFALFVGRLTDEKGVRTLLNAWKPLHGIYGLKLKVAGDGPLRSELENDSRNLPNVELVGRLKSAEIYDMMGAARMLIFPSQWYEGQPRTIVESLAKGTPVVASRLGSMAEMIRHETNGLLFEAGNPASLADQVKRLHLDDSLRVTLRNGARADFEANYTAERNYMMLMDVYQQAASAAGLDATVKPLATPGVADV